MDEKIKISLQNGGNDVEKDVRPGTEVGEVRSFVDDLEEIGVPSEYRLAVNGVQQKDTFVLSDGDEVTFRPMTGDKG